MEKPEVQTISVVEEKEIVKNINVDYKTNLPSLEINKILNVCTSIFNVKAERKDDKIVYEGKVFFQTIYIDNNGNLKKSEAGQSFSGEEEYNASCESCEVFVRAEEVKTEFDASGIKVGINTILKLILKIKEVQQNSLIKGCQDLVVKKLEVPIVKVLDCKTITYPVEEDFEVNYQIKEVLSQNCTAHITSVQCGVNCVIVDGEISFCALLLQNDENSSIIREEKNIPFRVELESQPSMPAYYSDATAVIRSFKTDVAVDGENNKSTFTVLVNLDFSFEVKAEERCDVAIDCFCKDKELSLNYGKYTYQTTCPVRVMEENLVLKAPINAELVLDARCVAVYNSQVEIAEVQTKGKGLEISGVYSVVGIFYSLEEGYLPVKLETPFSYVLDVNLPQGADIEVMASAKNDNIKMISLKESEISTTIVTTIRCKTKEEFSIIENVEEAGDKKVETSAISVYIGLKGEDLWSLAKRLNVTEGELLSANEELKFPLTGKERIVVYRQK